MPMAHKGYIFAGHSSLSLVGGALTVERASEANVSQGARI